MTNKCSEIDIIVGIPSYNEADNIAFVTSQVALGLNKYFPNHSAAIINVDNNSTDGTKEAFLRTETCKTLKKYISTEKGIVGKGNNLRNLFREVEEHRAEAVVVVDADLLSIKPEWIKTLVTPVLEGHDYVTPLYSRNEYDGTITNHITYPLLYSIFKADIRQPIGGDFAFSPKLARYWNGMEWGNNTRQYGIDIFMTTSALLNGFKVCQVALGSKVHKPSAPKLGPMFTQVITTLFTHISISKNEWMNGMIKKNCPVHGQFNYEDPQSLSVDYKSIKKESVEGFSKKDALLSSIMHIPHYHATKKMHLSRRWNIGSELWAKILYDFIFAYEIFENKKEVVDALKPLYFARAASFYKQTMDMTHQESEKKILRQAKQFHRCRGYLLNKFEIQRRK